MHVDAETYEGWENDGKREREKEREEHERLSTSLHYVIGMVYMETLALKRRIVRGWSAKIEEQETDEITYDLTRRSGQVAWFPRRNSLPNAPAKSKVHSELE